MSFSAKSTLREYITTRQDCGLLSLRNRRYLRIAVNSAKNMVVLDYFLKKNFLTKVVNAAPAPLSVLKLSQWK